MKIIPKPWLTAEVIRVIEEKLKATPNANVLEFGTGCSTAFFSQFTNNLVSIDNHPEWHDHVKKYIVENNLKVDLRLVPTDYYKECDNLPDNYFDLVLIDGHHRLSCLKAARRIVKPGGMLMFDDSNYKEEYQKAYEIMADWPKHEYTGTKRNPLDDSAPFKESTTIWWIKP